MPDSVGVRGARWQDVAVSWSPSPRRAPLFAAADVSLRLRLSPLLLSRSLFCSRAATHRTARSRGTLPESLSLAAIPPQQLIVREGNIFFLLSSHSLAISFSFFVRLVQRRFPRRMGGHAARGRDARIQRASHSQRSRFRAECLHQRRRKKN